MSGDESGQIASRSSPCPLEYPPTPMTSPQELRGRIRALAIDLIACGLDPDRCTLFVQSDVREHTELACYLASVTPMGDLGRMTQFKEKSEDREFVSTALFTYPVLMSADILIYKATI